jgi:hypothetical protein
MSIVCLAVIEYPPSGAPYSTTLHRDPAWADIEAAIDRLDRNRFPMIDLHAVEPADWDESEHALHVLGGRGEYYLELTMPDESRLEFHDPNRPDGTVAIWESDQGWDSAPTRILCHDRELLRRIVRHFADTGQPLAEVRWRPAE